MNPDLKLLFEKGYTPEKIRQLQAQGRDISTIAKFEMGYTPEDIRREKARRDRGIISISPRLNSSQKFRSRYSERDRAAHR